MEIKGVKIGDKFKNGKHMICEVVDFWEIKSTTTGRLIKHECIVKGVGTISSNEFEVPFATVVRNKI